jgi:hypothetical protein
MKFKFFYLLPRRGCGPDNLLVTTQIPITLLALCFILIQHILPAKDKED